MWTYIFKILIFPAIVFANLTNSTLYTLCRNSDLYEILETIINYEARFNSKYHYDWVFLNDEPFNENFKLLVSNAVSGNSYFGKIPEYMWEIPNSVNKSIMYSNINKIKNDPDGVYPYYDSISYRNMCRFESGFFYWHELLLNYDYFWRIEPGVKLDCDINYDIFKFMIENNFQYGFTISMLEYPKTIPTLFDSFLTSLNNLNKLDLLNSIENYSDFITNFENNDYNLCHFWTNFEIGNLNIFRSNDYNNIFKELDKFNGFYYERWGDAPIRTLILSLILKHPQIKRFENFGYQHEPYLQCPQDIQIKAENRCSCNSKLDITNKWYSCSWYFDGLNKRHSKIKMIRPTKPN
ncbi:hypothetical protein C6P40_000396 [Pichia californica]|uniref:Mannosyltransferase n=1 Tax=Pichia californica TaxID=460514 RepID=A0A9P7BGZ0_9ASCO|nr:hypothetical protein C6P42_003346 [[Candida] californica]KAG0688863.1 hypothetical protein C6P40_000396 [[Candida] californica]